MLLGRRSESVWGQGDRPIDLSPVQLPSKPGQFYVQFRGLSRVRSTESSGFMERAMGIEPRHDFRYVAESIGYSCQLPSKTVHNRVTDAKNPCQISSNSCRCDETQNATGRPCPKVGKCLFRFAEPRISRCGFPQPRRRIVSDPTARTLHSPVIAFAFSGTASHT